MLREVEEDVEVLDGGAGGALHEVVEAADQEHAVADDAGRDVAEVGVDRVLRAGQVVHHADEPLGGVGVAEELHHLALGDRLFWADIDRRENAAIHRGELRREDHARTRAGVAGDHLLDLGGVPVPAHVVGRHALVALGEVRHELGLPPRTAHTALGVDDDVVELKQAALHERRQRQDGRRRVAAGVGYERLPLDPVAKQLGQAVDRLAEPGGVGMLMAIPFEVGGGIVEPVVGAEIDDLGPRGHHSRQDLRARAVRQAAEHALGPRADFLRREILERQVEAAHEARVDARNRRLPFLPARHGDDLRLRMAQEDLDGLEGRVAGSAQDGDGDHGGSLAGGRTNSRRSYTEFRPAGATSRLSMSRTSQLATARFVPCFEPTCSWRAS